MLISKSHFTNKNYPQYDSLLLFLIFIIFFFCTFSSFNHLQFHDLSIYWKATVLLLEGKNPYDLPHQSSYIVDFLGNKMSEEELPLLRVWNMPFVFIWLIPFGLLPLFEAKILYLIMFIVGITAITISSQKTFIASQTLGLPFTRLSLWFGYFPFAIFLYGCLWGCISIFAAISFCLALYFWKKKFYSTSGVLSFVAFCIRPHLLFIAISLFFWFSLKDKKYRYIKGFISAFIATSVALYILRPEVFLDWQRMSEKGEVLSFVGSSLPSILAFQLGANQLLISFLFLLPLSVTLIYSLKNSILESHELISLSVAFWTVLSPLAWGHDYALSTPFMFFLFGYLRRLSTNESKFRLMNALLITANVSLIVINNFDGQIWIHYGLALFIMASLVLFHSNKQKIIRNRNFI